MASHVVAPVSEIPPGARKLVHVGRREIVVFNLAGEFFALSNRCPHLGGSLCDGVQTAVVESSEPGDYRTSRPGELVKCPWHGWGFDIRTGKAWCDPATIKVHCYDTSVRPGADVAAHPRAAETFDVRIEDDYVVVET